MERAQKKVESRNFDIRKTLIKFDDVMNDQRQVIFTQRLKILKGNNTSEIFADFFSEILKELEIIFYNYQKSNNEKYLIEIKNITGNSIRDEQIVKLLAKTKDEFLDSIKKIFFEQQKKRVEIIGIEQNKILEKKIFLQIIDFSWRSHLQYLEQLRQVIGLRQYGQKDPLSEFKKEAFVLFEGLLEKIKKDVIKLLLNLTIVVPQREEKEHPGTKEDEIKKFKNVGRNEKCPCGSGKKFKYCHGYV